MVVCCASGCTNRTGKPPGVTFHRLPKDKDMRMRWIAAIHRERWQPTHSTSICSAHFVEGDFDRTSLVYVRIRPGAVPSIFPLASPRPRKAGRKRKSSSSSPLAAPPVGSAGHGRGPGPPHATQLKSDHLYCRANSEGGPAAVAAAAAPAANSDALCTSALKRSLQAVIDTEKRKLVCRKRRLIVRQNAKLEGIFADLRKKRLVGEESLQVLQSSLSRPNSQLLKRPRAKSAELRTFALTLHLYSPKAYAYVRNTFSTCLPHPQIVSRWGQAAAGGAGFTREALDALERMSAEARAAGRTPLCALVADEMPLRPHVEWDRRRYHGRVDLGTGLDADSLPAARAALTFMLVAINASWKLPVGYFLIDGLSGSERANLVRRCLSAVHDAGAQVVSLTFDGAAANLSMARALGCCLEPSEQLKTHFEHPVTGEPVFLFLDPCHMLTLVRDALREKRSVADGSDGLVLWDHVERLGRLRPRDVRSLRQRLSAAQLAWFAGEAEARPAERLVSASLADAMDVCSEMEVPGFENSRPTATFVRHMNRLCDVLDSRNVLCKEGWKKPVSFENLGEVREFAADVQDYIRTLKDSERGDRLVLSRRKTGFIGFLVCCRSVVALYDHAFSKHKLRCLCTYRVSWDHLGMFFDAVRSQSGGGGDKDPTARQFASAYKRALAAHGGTGEGASAGTGAAAPDSASALRASSCGGLRAVQLINTSAERARAVGQDSLGFDPSPPRSPSANCGFSRLPVPADDPEWSDRAVACVARFVTRRLRAALTCERCAGALCGAAQRRCRPLPPPPSDDVVRICRLSERLFREDRRLSNVAPAPRRGLRALAAAVLDSYRGRDFFAAHSSHMFEQEPPGNHLVLLVQAVAWSYLAVRFRQERAERKRAETPAPAFGLYAKCALVW
ncbi:DNA transposase THAP9 [Petromyzon marinus]|uniref:DNA transposase THAP9 n=1 Tax=Petromyzon marinus TaxID=7757 RepID=UPI003F72C327